MRQVTVWPDLGFDYEDSYWEGRQISIIQDNSLELVTIKEVGPDYMIFEMRVTPCTAVIRAIVKVVRGEHDGRRNGRSGT